MTEALIVVAAAIVFCVGFAAGVRSERRAWVSKVEDGFAELLFTAKIEQLGLGEQFDEEALAERRMKFEELVTLEHSKRT